LPWRHRSRQSTAHADDLLLGCLLGRRITGKARDDDIADPEHVSNPKIPKCRFGRHRHRRGGDDKTSLLASEALLF